MYDDVSAHVQADNQTVQLGQVQVLSRDCAMFRDRVGVGGQPGRLDQLARELAGVEAR